MSATYPKNVLKDCNVMEEKANHLHEKKQLDCRLLSVAERSVNKQTLELLPTVTSAFLAATTCAK